MIQKFLETTFRHTALKNLSVVSTCALEHRKHVNLSSSKRCNLIKPAYMVQGWFRLKG